MDSIETTRKAREEFNRLQMSLDDNDYRIPRIGFSCNSKVDYLEA